jgi:hypothetical protein
MAERAASIVDEVLPRVPVRQWVLTRPYRLRYRLAWDHALCRAVLGVYARGLLAFYARTARSHGIRGGQTGTVTVIQRFGGGLQLNVHFHTLVFDGAFSEARPGPLTFHPAPPPSNDDVAHVLASVRARVGRLLVRRYLEPADDIAQADPLAEASPAARPLTATPSRPAPTLPSPRAWTWPALMHRVFALDVLACPRCGGRLRVIATVQDPLAVQAILATFAALGPPSRPALPHPPRPQSGRLPARSGLRSLTLAPLHPRLDREPAAAPDHWGPAGALDADPRLRPLDLAVPGPPPGLTGQAGRPRRRPPPRRWP